MKTITFYHSAICPRCRMASLSLSSLREEFPDLEIEPVELLTNRAKAKADGVRTIPAFVSGDSRLQGFYLTRRKIRAFLTSL